LRQSTKANVNAIVSAKSGNLIETHEHKGGVKSGEMTKAVTYLIRCCLTS